MLNEFRQGRFIEDQVDARSIFCRENIEGRDDPGHDRTRLVDNNRRQIRKGGFHSDGAGGREGDIARSKGRVFITRVRVQ